MTTNEHAPDTGQLAPLWSDRRIGEEAYQEKHFYVDHVCSDGVKVKLRCTPTIYCAGLMRKVRDDMQARIDTLEAARAQDAATIASLRADRIKLGQRVLDKSWENDRANDTIATLRAQLAEAQEALTGWHDARQWEPVTFDPDGDIFEQEMAKLQKAVSTSVHYLGAGANIALCRRVTTQEAEHVE